jgi:flavodoxin
MEVNMELTAQTRKGKNLVAYFSWSGNAKTTAGQIAQATGADLFEIRAVRSYPDDYDECTRAAKQELDSKARPALSGSVDNMEQYNTVFLCYPNWWDTMPMAVFTFLESYNFSGKTIYPLVTHGGSSFGRSLDDIKTVCPRSVVGEGLSVSAFNRNPNDRPKVSVPNKDISSWLNRIGMSN